jgi:hypothetical protein
MSSKSVVIALSIVLITAGLSVAEIPQVISYQGKVTDLGGVPVPDGTYTLRFRIYDDQTGGTLEWDSDDVSTPVSDGVFNVILGESPQPAVSLPFDDDYWLLVTVEGDDQIPRKRLGSTGYAFMASGLVPGTEVRGSVTSGSDAAISAVNTAATEPTFGLYGASASVSGRGVYGTAFATTGVTSGVSGRSYSTEGSGVYGYASAITGTTWGVRGTATSEEGTGVHGEVSGSSGTNYGVFGKSWSTAGYAVYGRNEAGGGTYGYLGSGDYGAYGRYDQFDYGYLGGSGIGVRGVSGTGIGVRGSVSGGGGIGVSGGTMDGTGV